MPNPEIMAAAERVLTDPAFAAFQAHLEEWEAEIVPRIIRALDAGLEVVIDIGPTDDQLVFPAAGGPAYLRKRES